MENIENDMILERYKIKEQLGEGSFGKLVKVKDLNTGFFFACKIVNSILNVEAP